MKKTILVLATVALLACAESAWAEFVSFKEGAAETDFVTIDSDLPQSIFLANNVRIFAPNPQMKLSQAEFGEVIFYLQGTLPLNNVGDTYTTLMVEPDGITPSDTAVLKLMAKDPNTGIGIFDLVFQSDGSAGFEPVEPNRIVQEDGTSQEIISLGTFGVFAQSDLEAIPEPSTMVSTGTALLLLLLAYWGRKRRV